MGRILPILEPFFDAFDVPLPKREQVVADARAELVIKHPDLVHNAEGWLLRRILRICTEEEAELFWGGGRLPEELVFREPSFFRRDPDQDR